MKRQLALVGTVLGVALAVSAVPAFTADNGTITVAVTAQAPPEQLCIEVLDPPGTSVSFGTQPFSTSTFNVATGNIVPRFRNCATANERIGITGTDATSGSSTWTLAPFTIPGPVNTYLLSLELDTINGGSPLRQVSKSPTTLLDSAAPGVDHFFTLYLYMPLVGSDGAGQTFSSSLTLLATAP